MASGSSSSFQRVTDSTCANEDVPAALRLAPSQLAEVLIRVPLVQRLRCCALVCKALYTASVLATRQVVFTASMSDDEYTAGFRWLQAHGQAAGVTSITFRANFFSAAPDPTQRLPLDQLTALQELELTCAIIPPLPAAVLTSLTYLHCWLCTGSIDELAAFTQLRHLAITGQRNRTDSQLLVFKQALPHLQALTHLSISDDFTQDAVMEGLRQLTCLQYLRVISIICTAALLEALPASLTRLEYHTGASWGSQLELSLSSTTHVQRLTALQHLALCCARAVHPSVLAALTGLTQLGLTMGRLLAGPQEPGWHVLSRLANLQHLDLRDTVTSRIKSLAPQLTAADIAALTAPSQLSCLHISTDIIQQEHFKHLLPADRQLHSLKELYATMDFAADLRVVVQLPRCCPNLQVLDLSMPAEGPGVGVFDNHVFATLCGALGALPELRTLELHMSLVKTTERGTWEALGSLEQLHSLGLSCVEWEGLHHVLQLTTCWQLTRLGVFPPDDAECEVINEAPPGYQSDVWQRMPHVLLKAVNWHLAGLGEKDPHALACMAHTAAGIAAYAVDVMNEQQQQLAESHEQVFALQQQLQAMQLQLQEQQQQQQDQQQ